MIKVLLVDDSPTSRFILSELINTSVDMKIIGEIDNGRQVLSRVRELEPNVILMDLFMPGRSGVEATKEIMSQHPTPIVIISGALSDSENDKRTVVEAMRYGALAVIKKPENLLRSQMGDEANDIIKTVRNMSHVKVIHHNVRERKTVAGLKNSTTYNEYKGTAEIVGISVSTGGPTALASIVKSLKPDFPLPVAVVQHITDRFLPPLVKWLDSISPLNITIAEDRQIPQPGHIYFAPIGTHLTLAKSRRFELKDSPQSLHMPSSNILFNSLAEVYKQDAIGVQLTGMGDDGAEGLKAMHNRGAFTIAQDEASSIVFGMPRVAIESGATSQVLPIEEIGKFLNLIVQNKV